MKEGTDVRERNWNESGGEEEERAVRVAKRGCERSK